jgi:serine/threonine-protein kinase
MQVIDGQWHLSTVAIENDGTMLKAGKPQVFLKTAADERYPSFSPDGRWLAYTSNQSGTYQVHVRPFPDRGGQWQVSSNGGTHPEWGRDGKTLFFRSLEQKVMAVDYAAKGDAFQPERPRVWSEVVLTDQGMLGTYTIHPDSKRMAAVLAAELADGAKPDTHVTILFNFLDELRRKVK